MRLTYAEVEERSIEDRRVRVYVKDGDDPIEGAIISGRLRSPFGGETRITLFTDEEGIATYRFFVFQTGDYTIELDHVSHDDYERDADGDRVSRITVPGLSDEVIEAVEEEESTEDIVGSYSEDRVIEYQAAVSEESEDEESEEDEDVVLEVQ